MFGWVYVDTADGMTNALTNGQYCSSGFAVYTGDYKAVCSTIKQVTSDFGPVSSPYQCTVGNPMNTCRYYYDGQSYITQACQCGFDATIGYCQYPGQQELTSYIQSIYPVYNASKCHTLDRFNLRAQAEPCGMGPQIALKQAVAIAFNITQWPYIQKAEAAKCILSIHPEAPNNLLNLNQAVIAKAASSIMVIVSFLCFLY